MSIYLEQANRSVCGDYKDRMDSLANLLRENLTRLVVAYELVEKTNITLNTLVHDLNAYLSDKENDDKEKIKSMKKEIIEVRKEYDTHLKAARGISQYRNGLKKDYADACNKYYKIKKELEEVD